MSGLVSHVEKGLEFRGHHPDIASYLPELEGVYARCRGELPPDLEQMYEHITHSCQWCKEEFAHLKQFKDSFTR